MQAFRKALSIVRSNGFRILAKRATLAIARFSVERFTQWKRIRDLKRLCKLPSLGVKIAFISAEQPVVSVVIPVASTKKLTEQCLYTLSVALPTSIPYEIIVVDDASSDDTAAFLASVNGVKVVRNAENRGFLHSANYGASLANGTYILFLNSDVLCVPGFIEPLLSRIECDGAVKAVGAKLVSMDGRIDEAGGILWNDATGNNYGRGFQKTDPRCNYTRPVDYCSGAALLVERAAFMKAGMFDARFAPAYYEDADLAFTLRKLGYATFYEPRSEVFHVRHGSYVHETKRNALMARNRRLFMEKWRTELAQHFSPMQHTDAAARRLVGARTIVFIDSFVPFPDRDAASVRLMHLLRFAISDGWHVQFLALDGSPQEPYATQLRALGVEVFLGAVRGAVEQIAAKAEVVWVAKHDAAVRTLLRIKRTTDARVIYDTVDLHFLRLKREEEVTSRPTRWRSVLRSEMHLASAADAVVVTSPAEATILRERIAIEPHTLPVCFETAITPGWREREGLLFVGNFTHSPNVDAACYLIEYVFPAIRAVLPEVTLTILGNSPTPRIMNLASDVVTVAGNVDDVSHYMDRARLLTAPLRFGAGVKGKIVHALARGLPVVTTSIGVEGLGFSGMLVADAPESFAELCVTLYRNESWWTDLSVSGRCAVAESYSPDVLSEAFRSLISPSGPNR